jgi:hypothetical protein
MDITLLLLVQQQEHEIAEAQLIINTLRPNHYEAYHERESKWAKEHPEKNSIRGQMTIIEETVP